MISTRRQNQEFESFQVYSMLHLSVAVNDPAMQTFNF